ncbi:MAG: hypothetical protein H2055_08315 [Sphingopyxis sp.]|nr:hypothetical protein [Sphingopyxis sp.]
MEATIGHNRLSEAERIADYLDRRADRFLAYARKTGNGEARRRNRTWPGAPS